MDTAIAAMYAQRSANNLLESVWEDRGFPVDPVWIAGKLGVTVVETDLPEAVLGALVKDKNKDPVIVINKADGQTHKRFNCAHKIGHYADHLMQKDECYRHLALRESHSKSDPLETFANRFSLELLMPMDEIKRLEREHLSATQMAQHFGVSEEALQDRIAETMLSA